VTRQLDEDAHAYWPLPSVQHLPTVRAPLTNSREIAALRQQSETPRVHRDLRRPPNRAQLPLRMPTDATSLIYMMSVSKFGRRFHQGPLLETQGVARFHRGRIPRRQPVQSAAAVVVHLLMMAAAVAGDCAIEPNSTGAVVIPDNWTSISDRAFYQCTSLTSVAIPNSVTSIGHNAFGRCRSLTSVTIPTGVRSIGNGAFHQSTNLTLVAISNTVTFIGEGAFNQCGLTSVTIPNSVIFIGATAFHQNTGLTSATIPHSVTFIGARAFYMCGCQEGDFQVGATLVNCAPGTSSPSPCTITSAPTAPSSGTAAPTQGISLSRRSAITIRS